MSQTELAIYAIPYDTRFQHIRGGRNNSAINDGADSQKPEMYLHSRCSHFGFGFMKTPLEFYSTMEAEKCTH